MACLQLYLISEDNRNNEIKDNYMNVLYGLLDHYNAEKSFQNVMSGKTEMNSNKPLVYRQKATTNNRIKTLKIIINPSEPSSKV